MDIFGLGIIVGLIVGAVVAIVCVRACLRDKHIDNENRCNNNENYDYDSDKYYGWCYEWREDEDRKG